MSQELRLIAFFRSVAMCNPDRVLALQLPMLHLIGVVDNGLSITLQAFQRTTADDRLQRIWDPFPIRHFTVRDELML